MILMEFRTVNFILLKRKSAEDFLFFLKKIKNNRFFYFLKDGYAEILPVCHYDGTVLPPCQYFKIRSLLLLKSPGTIYNRRVF